MTFEEEPNQEETVLEISDEQVKPLLKKMYIRNYLALAGLIIVVFIPQVFRRHYDFDVIHKSTLFVLMIFIVMAYMFYVNLRLFRKKDIVNANEYRRLTRHAGHLDLASFLMVLLAILVMLNTFFVSLAKVEGNSMAPTVTHQSDIVFAHLFQNYQRFDIVVVYIDDENYYLKRIIALPGEHVLIEDGNIYIDGSSEPLDEPFRYGTTNNCGQYCDFVVPSGHVFVLGDNRENSVDSRSLGPIAIEDLYGKVFFRLRPLTDFGSVK